MLAGKKKLAAFGDVLPEEGHIPEEIIPDEAFAPYVASGQIKRFQKIVPSPKFKTGVMQVCFTLPGEEWRAAAYLWIREMTYARKMPDDEASDTMIGRLLGYDEESIREFLINRSLSVPSSLPAA